MVNDKTLYIVFKRDEPSAVMFGDILSALQHYRSKRQAEPDAAWLFGAVTTWQIPLDELNEELGDTH